MPKKPFKLPVVLSPEEVMHFLECVASLKQRTILMTAYAAGLRVSEATHLKVTDIDSQRMMLRVDQGKGRQDRYVMLSPRLLEMLRSYWKVVRPKTWLFPGDIPGRPITRRCRGAGLPQGTPRVRHRQADHPALVAARVRHAPAGVRHRRAPHPAAAGSPQPGHHLALLEDRDQHGVRDDQPAGSVA